VKGGLLDSHPVPVSNKSAGRGSAAFTFGGRRYFHHHGRRALRSLCWPKMATVPQAEQRNRWPMVGVAI
jgi:hypothetical protein